jgi:hypothetical protein
MPKISLLTGDRGKRSLGVADYREPLNEGQTLVLGGARIVRGEPYVAGNRYRQYRAPQGAPTHFVRWLATPYAHEFFLQSRAVTEIT